MSLTLLSYGLMKQMHDEPSEQRRQGSGEKPAPPPLSLSLSLSLSGGLYFWNQLASIRPNSKYSQRNRGVTSFSGLLQHGASDNEDPRLPSRAAWRRLTWAQDDEPDKQVSWKCGLTEHRNWRQCFVLRPVTRFSMCSHARMGFTHTH